jgi:arylsulfatase A
VFHWYTSAGAGSEAAAGLTAVHCGDFKAHFTTQGDYAKEARQGKTPWPKGPKNPPLLFNLSADPSETTNVDPSTEVYAAQMKIIRAAQQQHLQSIEPVCSQNYGPEQGGCGGVNISYGVCGDKESKAKYPQWPKCTITPATWEIKLCV